MTKKSMARTPDVNIEYCSPCNYYPRAAGLAAELKKEFGIEAKLHKGTGGVFEVQVGGELIYSKRATGRFPEHEEIFYHVRQAASAAAK